MGNPAKAATNKIRDYLDSCGFSVEYMSNREVTVELLRGINRYGVIYLATHGGPRNGETTLSSGERPTPESIIKGSYAEDISTGRIGIGTAGVRKETYYYVTPSFFKDYRGNGYPKSLVYVSACNSLSRKDMANTFLNKTVGAAVYIGYIGFTSIGFAERVTDKYFFKFLAEKCITVEEAKNWKRQQGYGRGGLLAKMHFLGSGKTVICEAECPPCEGSGLQLDAGNSSCTVNGENFSVRCTYSGRSHDLLQDETFVDDVSSGPALGSVGSEDIPELRTAQDSLGNEQFVDRGHIYI
jgi:hypothetical protein